VRIHVIAEPKAGRKNPTAQPAVYDTPAAAPNSGDFALVDYSDLDQIVVWLEPVGARESSHPAPSTMQIDAAHPATSMERAVSVGQNLVIRNRGRNTQDIYSVSDGNDFDLGKVESGREGTYAVKNPGLIEILTDSAKDPVAQVYAAPSPWVALTHSGESVHFTNVPPGEYRIVSWHPRLPGTEQTIQLSADQVASASIKVGVNALPKVAPR